MDIFEAIILGIVQGLTEFLPVSSTAHLRIVPALFGWSDPGAAFTAVTQIGTLIAVLVYFRKDIIGLSGAFFTSVLKGNPAYSQESRLAWWILLGTIPIGLLGLLLKDFIENAFRSLYIIAFVLIAFSFVFYLAERLSTRKKSLEGMTVRDSQLIGLAQALALLPGVSRSGSTISAGLLLNFNREAAARFSFLLSIPAVALSGVYQLYKLRDLLAGSFGINLLIAVVVSGVVGFLSIAFLLKYLRNHSLNAFIAYRLALGLIILLLLQFNILVP